MAAQPLGCMVKKTATFVTKIAQNCKKKRAFLRSFARHLQPGIEILRNIRAAKLCDGSETAASRAHEVRHFQICRKWDVRIM
jgi:hypothetical protein